MTKVKSLEDLKKMREELKAKLTLRQNGDNVEELVQVKVSMATCGIASGAKEVMDVIIAELDSHAIDGVVTQTGCMGYCYAEPTIEVTVPGKDPVVFSYVDERRAREIVSKYIKAGELVDGILPVNYEKVD
ncbi:MAG: (2Fe-2S) ferredoxin domain-containing protein [Candidatus Delongbacteria bacterium]|nr:(2Fe-2S) ferredoxin domain-containing protein [Candidatus Delongbacteria bacterium]MBN2833825.1 (2Fe-2S) ferredoxin domain-containing protein [Candidatus Delongbacteria bacterium]